MLELELNDRILVLLFATRSQVVAVSFIAVTSGRRTSLILTCFVPCHALRDCALRKHFALALALLAVTRAARRVASRRVARFCIKSAALLPSSHSFALGGWYSFWIPLIISSMSERTPLGKQATASLVVLAK